MTVGNRTVEAEQLLQLLIMELEPAEQYLKSFHWNKVKYRADKPLGEIVVTLQKVSENTILEARDFLEMLILHVGDLKYRQRCQEQVQPV